MKVVATLVAAVGLVAPAKSVAHYYDGCKKNRCKRHVVRPYKPWLMKVGSCETRGYSIRASLRAHNPSGMYHGRFQFDLRSWAGADGKGDPHNHGLLEQRYRAVIWLHRAGRGAWPVCG